VTAASRPLTDLTHDLGQATYTADPTRDPAGCVRRVHLKEGHAMRRLVLGVLVAACAAVAGPARAGDHCDLTGTWKWYYHRDGKDREASVKLKMEGHRLTGALVGKAGQETKIYESTFKDGTVSFRAPGVTPDGNLMTHLYSGKVEGDTITGTVHIERDGKKFSGKWVARRVKD
jgi:hypothetical protein